ncbi:MAG TPA: ABC transporter substrate-binding protein [Ramlibacter sp.]|nr:ABC transporter substrate-binding protein [Ramlibacter sp.]
MIHRRALLRAGVACAVGAPALRAQANLPRGVLQIASPWEIGGLQPASSGHIFTCLQVLETVMGAQPDGTPAPALAERWQVSPDGLAWRFELRRRARFHDGTPVTASAVAASLERARTPPALLSSAPVQAIAAEGDHTLLVRLSAPYAALPALLAHSSTGVLAPASFGPSGQVRSILGTGPYRVTALGLPQHVHTAVFDAYDGPRPAIRAVRFLSVSRSETRALMAESGQAHLAYALDPASLRRLRLRPQLQVETVMVPRTVILKVNAGHVLLADPRVRQALSLAIDRVGIARALLRDTELAATQLLPPALPAWHDATLPALRHDPAEAARLLAQAGMQGQRVMLRTFPDRPELPIIATALQEQWRQAGLPVAVHIGNSGDVPLGHRDGSLQLALAARNYANVPDATGTLLQDFGPQGGDWGAMGWSDPAVSAALQTLARGQLTPARAQQLRRTVTRALQEQLPVIPITWYRQQVACSARLAGVSLDPLERSYRLTDMEWRA